MDNYDNYEMTEECETTVELFVLARLLVDKAGSLPCIEYLEWECPKHKHTSCPKDRLGDSYEFNKWKMQHGGDIRPVVPCWQAYVDSRRDEDTWIGHLFKRKKKPLTDEIEI